MTHVRGAWTLGLGALVLGLVGPSGAAGQATKADQDRQRLDSIEAIDKAYDQQHDRVESGRLEALAKLASSQSGDEAEKTYQHLFSLAVVEGRVEPAESAAEAYLKASGGEARTRALAAFVDVMSAAQRGEYDAAIADLKGFLGKGDSGIDPRMLYGLGETFLQRLNDEGEAEQAQAVANLFATGPFDKEVQEHFASRLERLKLIGQPAPAIDATDIDGGRVTLADLKGKVVLVNFWATWCPPCLAAVPGLNGLYDRYQDKGFEVIGVSTDAMREGADADEARSMLRQVAVDAFIPWPIVLNGKGGNDVASAYHVAEIPASYLIDADGKVVRTDLRGRGLEEAVAKLLGVEPEVDEAQPDEATQPVEAPAGSQPIRKPR
jgi:peroxiredoxin